MKITMKPIIELDEKEKSALAEAQRVFDEICDNMENCDECPMKSVCDTCCSIRLPLVIKQANSKIIEEKE